MAASPLRGPHSALLSLTDPYTGVLQRVPLPGPASLGEEAELPAHIPAPRQAEGRAHQVLASVSSASTHPRVLRRAGASQQRGVAAWAEL